MFSESRSSSDAAKPAKRTTRNSIRHSLNFASVGKALADVMNKDGKDLERRKSASSAKDVQSRRSSTVGFSKGALESVTEGQPKRFGTPDLQTVTQSRKSSSSLQRAGRNSIDEAGVKATSPNNTPQQSVPTHSRTSSILRPRNVAAGSALPKYRPKSVIEGASKKPASPVRAGTRRKHSSSEEEKDGSTSAASCAFVVHSPMDKASRPISPIPRRAAKAGCSPSSNIHDTPSPPPRKMSSIRESPVITSTPPRPRKTPKPSSSPVVKKSALPRPSPHDESSRPPSASPHTPTLAKSSVRYLVRSGGRESPSPLRSSSALNGSASPRKSATKSSKGTSNQNTPTGFMSENSPRAVSEGISCDSIEAGDVELMLAAVASPSAPTPAIPRVRNMNLSQYPPQTPSRSSLHPPRSTLGLSLHPPNRQDVAPSPRKLSPDRRPTIERSSIAAWEKLADLSAEINATELGGLITEMDLPMTPGLLSPSPSVMRLDSDYSEGPESPTPLSLPSPGGYTSISQVLLPAVTPSPAIHIHNNTTYSDSRSGRLDVPSMDSASSTLLKLQLASMENLAKERLAQITQLEEQMHAMKMARKRDEQELAEQVTQLEERLRETLAAREQAGTEDMHVDCRANLDERLRREEFVQQQAVSEALAELSNSEQAQRDQLRLQMERRQQMSLAVRDADERWKAVRQIAVDELESIRINRETLAVLLSGLDFLEAQFQTTCCFSSA